ncbi:alpha/beta fold hydrolase [Neobacillus sp. GCM10023253]|uniref:alpha/beta fold hydrolase n=1 Tax=Neobacillus sp. GCM10023253 TaxID=3252644 RepID=UPI00362361FB
MPTNTANKEASFLEKEQKRWERFFNTLNSGDFKFGHTTRQLVWKKNKATLWHYPAATTKKYDVPIFIVYSLFNQPTILDFAPGSSVLEGLVNRGYDVYLLDWGVAGYEDKNISIEDYVASYIKKAVQRALRHSGAEEISVVGYCLGGTLAAMYASIAEEPIKNLVTAAVPIDFSVAASLPENWAEAMLEGNMNLDRFIEVYGLVPPVYVEAMFRSITSPVYNTPYTLLLSRAHDQRFTEKWHRMNTWTKGHVPLTGGAFKQLNEDLFKGNKLVKGEFTIHGKKADLKNIKANLLAVSMKSDNLIPEEQSKPIMDLVSSVDKTFLRIEGGHVNLAMSGKFAGILDDWLSERSTK